jgi:hypothetical protein
MTKLSFVDRAEQERELQQTERDGMFRIKVFNGYNDNGKPTYNEYSGVHAEAIHNLTVMLEVDL